MPIRFATVAIEIVTVADQLWATTSVFDPKILGLKERGMFWIHMKLKTARPRDPLGGSSSSSSAHVEDIQETEMRRANALAGEWVFLISGVNFYRNF